jgi:hypothetical protein
MSSTPEASYVIPAKAGIQCFQQCSEMYFGTLKSEPDNLSYEIYRIISMGRQDYSFPDKKYMNFLDH